MNAYFWVGEKFSAIFGASFIAIMLSISANVAAQSENLAAAKPVSVRTIVDLTEFGGKRMATPCTLASEGVHRLARCSVRMSGLNLTYDLDLIEKDGQTCTTVAGVEICSDSEIIIIVVPQPID